MTYTLKVDEVTQFIFRATRFYYTTSQGKYLLLSWIAKHIDQAGEAVLFLPPSERPETWLADMELSTKPLWIPPMGRVVDVSKIGGLDTGPGRFAARIAAPLCPWNAGAWEFQNAGGALQVGPAPEAEFTLSIQALSALVYGTHAVENFAIRWWGDPSPEAREVLKSMFPIQMPFIHLFF